MPRSSPGSTRRRQADAPEWAADITVDAALVRRLLRQQFPDVPRQGLRLLGEGWDNAVWLAGGATVFRFPRRAIAVPGVEREIRVLPRLAGVLPVAIPSAIHIGHPSDAYPWPFFGGPVIDGSEPARIALRGSRAGLGGALGRSLRSLHDPLTLAIAGAGLPQDPNRRGDLELRIPLTRQRLAAMPARLWTVPPGVDVILRDAAATKGPSRRVVVHGDLHVRHLLLRPDGSLGGLIDWGDVCVADPAIDLSLYWSLLDRGGRMAFRRAYADPDIGDLLPRARLLSLFLNAALAAYADDIGDTALVEETVRGLERTLVDD